MTTSIAVQLRRNAAITAPGMYRVIYDDESEGWGYKSRTESVIRTFPDGTTGKFDQLPAVYGYSDGLDNKPDNYRVDETPLKAAYYVLNDYNTSDEYDGLGRIRCDNFLFKDDVALYNVQGFPGREMLTMSGNQLQELLWQTDAQGRRFLKFRTLKPGDSVTHMSYRTHPQFVHRFEIVSYRNGVTITTPRTKPDYAPGYLYYYLVSKTGSAFMPERFVVRV